MKRLLLISLVAACPVFAVTPTPTPTALPQNCGDVVTAYKCGFQGFIDTTKYYLTSDTEATETIPDPGCCADNHVHHTCVKTLAGAISFIRTYDATSCEATTTTNTNVRTTTACDGTVLIGTMVDSNVYVVTSQTLKTGHFDDSGTCFDLCPGFPAVDNHTYDGTITLSDEYTTEMLIANALALLGDCPEGCTATYLVYDNETACDAWCTALPSPTPTPTATATVTPTVTPTATPSEVSYNEVQ